MADIQLDSQHDAVLYRDQGGWTWTFSHTEQEAHPSEIDIVDGSDRLVLTTHLVGLKPEDLVVKIADDTLTVKTVHEFEEDTDSGNLVLTRVHDHFDINVGLPQDADPDQIEASYEDDLLKVSIPKSSAGRARTLSVTPQQAR